MPNTGVPLCSSAISVPQIGKPAMKDLVPSIGSSTQTYSASSRSLPNSSPTMPCWGKFALISRRITASAARSASVTGSKSLAALVVDAERGAEERQDGFAGGGGEPADEGGEIDDRHGCSFERSEDVACPCLAQSGVRAPVDAHVIQHLQRSWPREIRVRTASFERCIFRITPLNHEMRVLHTHDGKPGCLRMHIKLLNLLLNC